jgi:hypothetical protein
MTAPTNLIINTVNNLATGGVSNARNRNQVSITFKVEHYKIPEFFGKKGNDIIKAHNFSNSTATNNWNDTTAYKNFINAFK